LSQNLGENNRAIQDFNQALQINPKFAPAYLKRGKLRSRQGDLNGGVKDYSQAIQLEPDYADAYYNRGVLYYKLGNKDAALQDFISALQFHQMQGNQVGMEQAGAAVDAVMAERNKKATD